MASKKTGRLAGLAALAGAAYMADKKGMFDSKSGNAKTSSVEHEEATSPRDRMPAAAPEEGESAQSKFRKAELEAGDIAAMAPRKVSPTAARPSASTAGAMRSIRSDVGASSSGGSGRSGGRGGAEAGEEAAYNAEKKAQQVKDFMAPRPGIMARMREKDREMFKNMKLPKEPAETEREPAPDLASAYSGADTYKRGGAVKKMASGGMTSSASKRADGIAQRGKTRA